MRGIGRDRAGQEVLLLLGGRDESGTYYEVCVGALCCLGAKGEGEEDGQYDTPGNWAYDGRGWPDAM